MAKYGGIRLNKGDLFTVDIEGKLLTVCVLGSYPEECSGEEMIILAVVDQENMVHIPAGDLDRLFAIDKFNH
jgi:hypothetical protein